MDKIKSWITNNKIEFAVLVLILLIGAFLRLYKIDQYMTFLGDEGRDVIIVRRLLVEHHPPLIGPGTSIGNMYLGPAYYYMMAIPLLIFNFNPVGPAVFIALLGVVTIFFLWFVASQWLRGRAGPLVAAFLYAISPVIIIYSRSSWNPNIMPFFSLSTIYFLWRFWQKHENKSLIVAAISFAFCLQSHYLALLIIPVILIVWFLTYIKAQNKRRIIIYSFISVFVFLLIMSPLAIFDFRHNFINFNAIKAFFTNRETTVSVLPWKAIPAMWPNLINITTDLVGAKNISIGLVVSGAIALCFAFLYFVKREKYNLQKTSVIVLVTLWLGFALIGFGLYKQHIYDHYYGFIFTAPFLIIGGVIQFLINSKRLKLVGGIITLVFVAIVVFFDFINSPIKSAPNMQLQRAEVVSKKVEEISGGQKFNFALIADSNYDSAYRYFLDLDHAKVIDIDVQDIKDTITPQLIVVCERVKEKCDPTHNPKTEVAAFGWSKIEAIYDNVFGVTIYKLGHAK